VEPAFVEAERIEAETLRDLGAAAAPEVRVEVAIIAGATLFSARTVPGILFNRVIGLGVFAPARHADATAVVAHFAERGVGRYLVHLHPDIDPPRMRDWLAELRLLPFRRAWAKFARGLGPIDNAETSLRVDEVGAERASDFTRVVAEGYGMPPPAEALLRPLPGRARWHTYLSCDGDRAAGAAAMFIDGDVAWLGFGATEPLYRGRGSQRALLARRLRDGLALGVRRFYVETGEAIPGEPQTSYRNILRAGFERIYVRDNLCPESAK